MLNLDTTRTPLGFVTTYVKDAYGRDSIVTRPIDPTQGQVRVSRWSTTSWTG